MGSHCQPASSAGWAWTAWLYNLVLAIWLLCDLDPMTEPFGASLFI